MFEYICPTTQLACLVEKSSNEETCKGTNIALHGWLDNARSFEKLIPLLPDYDWYAIDLPGHGRSPHKSSDAEYNSWSFLNDVSQFISGINGPVNLVCHSMGTISGIILAALFPDKVAKLILLDAIGPLVMNDDDIVTTFSEALKERTANSRLQSMRNHMVDFNEAIKKRIRANPYLTKEEIAGVCHRNILRIENKLTWRTDPKLKQKGFTRLNENQVKKLANSVNCPVLAIRGNDSFVPLEFFDKRVQYFSNIVFKKVAGHHHWHLNMVSLKASLEDIDTFLTC